MILVFLQKAHIAEDPGSRIPAAVRFEAIVHYHFQVVVSLFHRLTDIDIEWREAIFVFFHKSAVQRDLCLAVDAFKVDPIHLFKIFLFEGEVFFIDVLSTREESGIDAVIAGCISFLFDHRIVRKIDLYLFSLLICKRPVFVECIHHTLS